MAKVSKGKFLYIRRIYTLKEYIRKIVPKGNGIDIFALCNHMGTKRLQANLRKNRRVIQVPPIMMGTSESWNTMNKIATATCKAILQRQELVRKDG